jgi:carbon monoxide dehydrogenase subunit G
MDMAGEYRVEAPRDRVWAALNDPDILRQCIPGCQSIEKVSPTEFNAKVTAKVGPVKATFSGAVTLSDLDPPNGYKISGEGKGGVAGFAKGGAEVRLEPQGEATLLRYTVSASVGGKLAQIGSRLIDGTAKKLSDEFFAKFAEVVAGAGAPAAPEAAAAPEPMAAPGPSAAAEPPAQAHAAPPSVEPPEAPAEVPGAGKPGVSPLLWVGAVVLAIVALLAIFR